LSTSNELHSQSQGYYQSPDGGAQELGAVSYQSRQQQQQEEYQYQHQYYPGVVTQPELPADSSHTYVSMQGGQIPDHSETRYELQ
jgi:hypothetical protein